MTFFQKLKEENERISFIPVTPDGKIYATVIPFFVSSNLKLTVLLEKVSAPGVAKWSESRLNLKAVDVELPKTDKISIEDLYNKLGLDSKMQNSIPMGAVMRSVDGDDLHEMVLFEIEPPTELPENIGMVEFDELVEAIQSNYIQDSITRLLLSELYILMMENQQNDNNEPVSREEAVDSYGGQQSDDDLKAVFGV